MDTAAYSMTIHSRLPLRYDPWYLTDTVIYRQWLQEGSKGRSLCDMVGIQLGKNLNFLLNVLNFVLRTLEVDDLYCDCLLRPFVETVARCRRRADVML